MPSNIVMSAPFVGSGKYKAMTDYNYASVQGLHGGVGTLFKGGAFAWNGRVYQVVQNRHGGDLAVGDCVSLNISDSTRTGNLATGVTVANLLTDDTHDTDMTGDQAFPSTVVVTAGVLATTADMQIRDVKSNVAAAGASLLRVANAHPEDGPAGTDITSADILTGTPDNTWDYTVFEPYAVVKTDLDALATCYLQGVVISTVITDNYFGIIQLPFGDGIAKVDGTTDLVVGDALIPDSASGVLSKWVVGAPDANGVTRSNFICARILDAYTNDGVGLRHVQFRDTGFANFPRPIL